MTRHGMYGRSRKPKTLLDQARDHSRYADYTYLLLPATNYAPKWFKNSLASEGFGLMVYSRTTGLVEPLEAHYNKPKDKALRKRVYAEVMEKGRLGPNPGELFTSSLDGPSPPSFD